MATATLRLSSLKSKADVYIYVVVFSAPTFRNSRAEEDEFFDDLQSCFCDRHGRLLLLGNFNARVGLRHDVDDEWAVVHGPRDFGERNEAEWSCSRSLD